MGKADLRNDLAKARDTWLASDEASNLGDGVAYGVYLENRLIAAFIAGWNARARSGETGIPVSELNQD